MLKLKQLHSDAIKPTTQMGDACYDLYALEDVDFAPGEIKLVRTGWSAEVPVGWRMNIYVRSSTPLKKKFLLANSVGIVDNGYRGELMVQLMNINTAWMDDKPEERVLWSNSIKKGDRIAQFEIVPNNPAVGFPIEIVDVLGETKRGEGGFGSTG